MVNRISAGVLTRIGSGILTLAALCALCVPCAGQGASVKNLALAGAGGIARSWEPGVTVVPEHEPSKVNDGSLLSYWAVHAVDLPADIGVEWRERSADFQRGGPLFRRTHGAWTGDGQDTRMGAPSVLGPRQMEGYSGASGWAGDILGALQLFPGADDEGKAAYLPSRPIRSHGASRSDWGFMFVSSRLTATRPTRW